MTEQDTYQGWANRETWAFWLHVTNDQGWYEMVKEQVGYQLEAEPDDSDSALGEAVVGYVREHVEMMADHPGGNVESQREFRMMRDEIGSWWRIDLEEIGRAARELVDHNYLADDGAFYCNACGRAEGDCSANPCAAVIRDRQL